MKEKNNFLNRMSVSMLRLILAGVLLLSTGIISARPTLQAGAAGLERDLTGRPLVGDGRDLLEPLSVIDDFPGAPITSFPYLDLNVDISGATSAADDPSPIVIEGCNSNKGEQSVWYSYNPGNQNAFLSISTVGSDYDTLLAVWTGTRGNLSLVACNDDISLFKIQSKVKLFAQANTTYYIEIIKFAEPASGFAAQGNTLDFRVSKINYVLDPPILNFGTQLYRNMTAVKTVTYTNYDGNPIQIGTLSIDDSYSKVQTMFLKNNTCDNAILNYGQSCTFGVAFRPWVSGLVTGQVSIPSDAPDQPHLLDIKGTGTLGKAIAKNFSFEVDNNRDQRPDLWFPKNLTNGMDVRTSKFSYHQKFSMRLVGQKPQRMKMLTQVINKKGVAGDDFYLQAWSKAVNVPLQGTRFFVYWYNGTKLIGKQGMVWGKGTYSFKTRWKAFTAPKNYTRIVIKISYSQTSGTVWIDQVTLRWAPSPD